MWAPLAVSPDVLAHPSFVTVPCRGQRDTRHAPLVRSLGVCHLVSDATNSLHAFVEPIALKVYMYPRYAAASGLTRGAYVLANAVDGLSWLPWSSV